MSEKIIIENFGGLKKVEFELRNINILIGPQASGKSVAVKLLYFFKMVMGEMIRVIDEGNTIRIFDKQQIERFIKYFPKESWPTGAFKIQYFLGENWVIIEKQKRRGLFFRYSDNYKNLFDKGVEILQSKSKIEGDIKFPNNSTYFDSFFSEFQKTAEKEIGNIISSNQIFIPAGRSFFANVESNIFSFLKDDKSLDPFLIHFGSFYQTFKQFLLHKEKRNSSTSDEFNNLVDEVINGKFQRLNRKDYIIHDDARKVNLANASSGQQEILPLIIMLKALTNKIVSNGAVYYIEEPEAHLFPTAQKKIVQLLARTFNSNNNFQIIITTHSPYILSAFNNLIEAGKIVDEDASKEKQVNKVIPKEEAIHPKDIIAYSLFNGKKKVLIDKTTKLIAQNELDAVSDELSIEFGKLLDIEF